MTAQPLKTSEQAPPWYGASDNLESSPLLPFGSPETDSDPDLLDEMVAEAIYSLFVLQQGHWYDLASHPATNPKLCPERRFKRHRNYYIYQLNQFRHWWKTSRLLVRLTGGYEYCLNEDNWTLMAKYLVSKKRQAKKALRSMKDIGQGGYARDFLQNVKKFTRTIRLILAIARGFEARVDNRFMEVLLAEALFGRQVTYNTYKFANFRWRAVQNLHHFNEYAGVYQDTVLDPELELLAQTIAGAIGHGSDAVAVRENMHNLGFGLVGTGKGGYCIYTKRDMQNKTILRVHMTPYGPSILNEMPRYLVLERRLLSSGMGTILDAAAPCLATASGFTYSGAFFKSQEWAALTQRFHQTLNDYETACKRMGSVPLLQHGTTHNPPTDLFTLKEFIRSGHEPKKQRKDKRRWKALSKEVKRLSSLVARYQANGTAPKRIILYLEGLDCAAKSSTGGLVLRALEGCGYRVRIAQHNRPPTEEQKTKPWMDRGRFQYPEDMYQPGEDTPEYTAVVWDRGPAGDFVYGAFKDLEGMEREEKYAEFRAYDEACENHVLFCKLLFVTDKDSIATTLGKRLAHKQIARDLRTWLEANSFSHSFSGLDEIEHHIDPTDFVAFNRYKQNLSLFTEFARGTDAGFGDGNPWTVVNTSNRQVARLALLRTFESQFARISSPRRSKISSSVSMFKFTFPKLKDDAICNFLTGDKYQQVSFRALLQTLILLLLLYFYAFITWEVDIRHVVVDW
eukprot:Nitzschia sp. Nitz4//scaffold380_size13111//5510//7999//NITZ4_008982-RA/size13111-augustus-gene-0.39-mRNA-1//-1//CDS//3329549879//3720//frame0